MLDDRAGFTAGRLDLRQAHDAFGPQTLRAGRAPAHNRQGLGSLGPFEGLIANLVDHKGAVPQQVPSLLVSRSAASAA